MDSARLAERERSRPDPRPDRTQILERLVIALSTAASVPAPWLFPKTVASPLAAYDSVGLGAGRSAADTAMLDVRDSIAG